VHRENVKNNVAALDEKALNAQPVVAQHGNMWSTRTSADHEHENECPVAVPPREAGHGDYQ